MAPKAKRLAGGGANTLPRRLRHVAKTTEKVFIRMRKKMSPYEAFDLAMDRLHRRSRENETQALAPVKHMAAMIKEAGVPLTKEPGETAEDEIRWAKKLKRALTVTSHDKLKNARAPSAGSQLPMCVRNEYDLDSGLTTARDLSLPGTPGQQIARLPPTPGYGDENTTRSAPPPITPMAVSLPSTSAGSRGRSARSAVSRAATGPASRAVVSATSRGPGEGRRRVRAAPGVHDGEPLDMDSYPM